MARSCILNSGSRWIVGTVGFLCLTASVVAQSPALPSSPPMPAQLSKQAPPTQAPSPQLQADSALISQGLATAAPATLLQKPPVPPSISFQNGLLSIDAPNSNLSDVLSAVRRATGAVIEGGGGAESERVVVHLGPGRPSDVLSTLLNGSRYNYVLLGAPQRADAVTRIVLILRAGGDQFPAAQVVVESAPSNDPDDDSREELDRANRRRASTDEAGQWNTPQPAPVQPPNQQGQQEQASPPQD
jgi:hypothetical protein